MYELEWLELEGKRLVLKNLHLVCCGGGRCLLVAAGNIVTCSDQWRESPVVSCTRVCALASTAKSKSPGVQSSRAGMCVWRRSELEHPWCW